MEFLPEKIVRTTGNNDTNGTNLTSRVYSLEGWANISLVSIFGLMAFGSLMGPLVSGLLVILYCVCVNEHSSPITFNIAGILISCYLILDFNKGWLVSLFLKIFLHNENLQMFSAVNSALLITHIFLLLLGRTFFTLLVKSRFILLLFTIGVAILAYTYFMYTYNTSILKLS